MKKTLATILASVVWLGGCSGRTDDQTSDESLAIAAAQASLNEQVRLLTTTPSLATGSGDTATIVAVVTDNQNRVVPDRDIVFSADGGALQNIEATTNEQGEARAQLSLAGDYRNRNITVTADMGGNSASILVAAAGTSIAWSAPENIIQGDSADLEFTLTAGNDQPIPNQPIRFLSEVGNTFTHNLANTDANGKVRVTVGSASGADVITVTAVEETVVQAFNLNVVVNEQAIETPVRVRVISNESAIETGGNDVARITTLVTDENNRVISGKPVEFSSTGGVLQNITSITNEAGQANAELSLAGDYRNQDITVTAQVDEQVGSVLVTTSGTSLAVSGPTALVAGNTAELEISLTGGNDQAIANEVVSITSLSGNDLSASTVTTDSSGRASVVVGSSAGSDTITFSSLGSTVVATHEIQVAADILSVIAPADFNALEVNADTEFQVLWESNEAPQTGTLKFSVTSGTVQAYDPVANSWGSLNSNVLAATNASGVATVRVSSTAAGLATLAFSDAADADPKSQVDLTFVAVDPASIVVEANPASVGTGNESTIIATVIDPFGNPVEGVEVEFSGPVLLGGSLSQVAALTDNEGKARVTFIAGSQPTAQDEIEVLARVVVDPQTDPVTYDQSITNLTVTEQQLNVIIGLAGNVSEADADTRYRKAGLVQVTDGAGRPVPDATISMSMVPLTYSYGFLRTVDTDRDGEDDSWGYGALVVCQAEDQNYNRVLDTVPFEDINGNGVLDPSDPGLVDADGINKPTVIGGQITTDANGVGFFSMAYPQSNGWWFDVQIVARVQALGVEAVATYDTGLDVAASDVNDVAVTPPNYVSPYGQYDASIYSDPSVCVDIPLSP